MYIIPKGDAEAYLENKYASRGLKFEEMGFFGSHPLQADGVIDGLEFYFRFRFNTAFLSVGEKMFTDYSRGIVLFQQVWQGYSDNDYKGDLDTAEQIEVFSYLADNLIKIIDEEVEEQREQAKTVVDQDESKVWEALKKFLDEEED